MPLQQPKPKRKPRKEAQSVVAKHIHQPPAIVESLTDSSSRSASHSSAARGASAQSAPQPSRAPSESSRSRGKSETKQTPRTEHKPTARESWLTINRTKSVSAVFRRSSSEYVAHLANVEASWAAGLGASMVQGAKADPRWVAAKHANMAAVNAALATRKARRSTAALEPSATQASSLLGAN